MENLKDEELSSLWIDKPDILEKLNSLDFSQYKYLKKENITEFEKSGFTIIKNAIPNEDIDNLLKITDNVTALLAGNPEVNANVLTSMLKGVIHKFEGNYFITRGDVKSDTRSNKTAARELVFPKNLQVMEELNSRFPNIFQLERKSGGTDVVVKINPIKTLEEQELTNEEYPHPTPSDVMEKNIPFRKLKKD